MIFNIPVCEKNYFKKDDLEKTLKLKPVKIRGFTRSDDYGMMFFAKEVTLLNSDSVKEQAENLISEMGV